LKSLAFIFKITVRAVRDSLREGDQSLSEKRRIMGSVSAKQNIPDSVLR